jgi:uncharacterized protein (DUF169 family)
MTGKPNVSLGCNGSRKFSGIADDKMVIEMPAVLLPEITEALKTVTGAPGSVELTLFISGQEPSFVL